MKLVVKYKVEKPFTDKYSKEEVKQNDIIEVTVERMKELNVKSVGKVVDIIVIEETDAIKEDLGDGSEENNSKKNENELGQVSGINKVPQIKFVREELDAMTVNQLKDLAEKNNIELTNVKKQDIIDELMNK